MHWRLPDKLFPFQTKKKRYKIAYGGRGGAKTRTFAHLLIIRSFEHSKQILCCREVQRSTEKSVYKVLEDIIKKEGLGHKFHLTKSSIKNLESGAEFVFTGLLDHTTDSLKSFEGVLYCWVEEAQSVSNNSWRILIPTIREPGSEIWISLNRRTRHDSVWERFCRHPDKDTLLINVNYYDNPYFGEPLKSEMEKCKKNDEYEYRHVWLGEPEQTNDARVYYNFKRDINLVTNPIQINPYAETWTCWDFGVSDATAIIVLQVIQVPKQESESGLIINIIDYYENNGQDYKHYAQWVRGSEWYKKCQNLQHAGDPSGVARGASLLSWIGGLESEGIVIQRPATNSPEELASKANSIMPSVRLCEDQTPRVLDIFEEWLYPVDKKTNSKIIGANPTHDEFSHGGTAFYYWAGVRFPIYGKSTMRMI